MDRRNISPQKLSKERQEVLLDSALKAFVAKGYGACSIDYIAKLSGVSKSTIYRHFSNKAEIFEAINLRIADKQAKAITAYELSTEQPAECLMGYARHIYSVDTQAEFLEPFRLLIAEAGRMPSLISSLRELGIMKVLSVTRLYFQALIDKGLIDHPDAEQAAITFYVLARGNFRPLLGRDANMANELKRLDIDIVIFLKGLGLTV